MEGLEPSARVGPCKKFILKNDMEKKTYYVLVYDENENGSRRLQVKLESDVPRTARIINGRFRSPEEALAVMSNFMRFDSEGFLYAVPEPSSALHLLIDRYRDRLLIGLLLLIGALTVVTIVNSGFILIYLSTH